MATEENETLEPPARKSIDDPGAHDLGKATSTSPTYQAVQC